MDFAWLSARTRRATRGLVTVLAALTATGPALASNGQARVAVAANFTEPARELGRLFEAATGNTVVLSFGATGQFFAQISQGAPFEVLLAADQATPQKAVAAGLAVDGTRFTYAIGKLVLYSRTKGLVDGEGTLKAGKFAKLAIANPATAPYGAAAMEVLRSLGLIDALTAKIVQGNSIGQAFQFVETGNAELGFVALAQVALVEGGSRWVVPDRLHAPIAQDAVLLKAGADNAAAKAFLLFLKGAEAGKVIAKFGYAVGE